MKHRPLILFGAFDRHNFGDLLFPHLVGTLLGEDAVVFAGLADRDLRSCGGYRVHSLASLKRDQSTALIHCGGELLTCTAYQAAVMLQSPAEAEQAIARYDADAEAASRWAAEVLQTNRAMPYVASPAAGMQIFNAVGGVDWPLLSPAQQNEVIATLKQAAWVSVRDRLTQSHLHAAGIDAPLCPDAAVMVRESYDDIIQQRRQQGEVAELGRAFTNGYLACQFNAEFGDDQTLDQLAEGLGKVCAAKQLGLVLFRAGAAPWHDKLEVYERLQQRLGKTASRIFKSLQLWDICALIASSRAYCGSSLHGNIVAAAYGVPRLGLISPQSHGRPSKVAAYLQTWEADGFPGCVTAGEIGPALIEALARSNEKAEASSMQQIRLYRESQQRWMAMLA